MLLDFIVKYWLEVVFGLICATIAWVARKYIKLLEENRKNHQEEIVQAIEQKIEQKMDDQYDKTQQQMDDQYKRVTNLIEQQGKELKKVDIELNDKIAKLQANTLAIEGAYFKDECRKLLALDHFITESEYNTITVEHIGYNGLGGNHEGDALYESIQHKFHNQQVINNKKGE